MRREDDRDLALLELLALLRDRRYHFTTPTPRTHAIVLARDPAREASSIEDVLGWSRPFRRGSIDSDIEALLDRAGVVAMRGGHAQVTIRVSSLGEHLFVHSAYPTTAPDAVFFGPDSYRFAHFLTTQLAGLSASSVVDVGTGSGVGAVIAAAVLPRASIAMTDINPAALRFARINAVAAGIEATALEGDILADVRGPIDVAIANPPYILDADRRAYRDGGNDYGSQLSLRMIDQVLPRLKSEGRFCLYTGSAIIDGKDPFRVAAHCAAEAAGCAFRYHEIDPDVFAEELARPAYANVDRIAVVGALFVRT